MDRKPTNLYLAPKIRRGPRFVSPRDFLMWAQSDLKGSDKRSCGNALGNIKKALHSKIDEIIWKTHVRYTRDWDPQCSTETKLKVLKKIGVEHREIVTLITNIRNRFEHKYFVPTKAEVSAYLGIADMWMERVKDRYNFQPVGLVGLVVKELLIVHSSAGCKISKVNFSNASKVEFFWNPKKAIVSIAPDGTKETIPYDSMSWEEILDREKKHIRSSYTNFQACGQAELTKVFRRYEKWIGRQRNQS